MFVYIEGLGFFNTNFIKSIRRSRGIAWITFTDGTTQFYPADDNDLDSYIGELEQQETWREEARNRKKGDKNV